MLPLPAQAHEERADDGGEDAGAADEQRHFHAGDGVGAELNGGEQHRGHQRHRVGLEQVRRHAGAVAHVVAHVVRDNGGVARIVLGNAGLDLADEIRPDVRAFGEDAAAQAGEDGDERAAERKRHQRLDQGALLHAQRVEQAVIPGHTQQPQPHHQHAGDGAGAERDVEGGFQARHGGLGGAHVRPHRNVHADVAGHARKHRADHEAARHPQPQRDRQHDGDDDADHADGAVLAVQIRCGAFLNRAGDFLHPRAAGVSGQHRPTGDDSINERERAAGQRDFQDVGVQAVSPKWWKQVADGNGFAAWSGSSSSAALYRNRRTTDNRNGHAGRCVGDRSEASSNDTSAIVKPLAVVARLQPAFRLSAGLGVAPPRVLQHLEKPTESPASRLSFLGRKRQFRPTLPSVAISAFFSAGGH